MQTLSSELLDIVNDADQVIGTLTRGEVHRQGLMHRSVHIIVLDGQGSILLQKRSMQKDQCGGMWDTACAGHVESGQSYPVTAVRELQEELGVVPDVPLTELFKITPTKGNGQEFAMVYSLQHQGPFVPAEVEIDELRWFAYEAVDEWAERVTALSGEPQDLTTGFIELWRRFREPHD